MSSARNTQQFLNDRCRNKYSWAAGVTRGTPSAVERHRRDLDTAFAEIDGLMAGLHYQDKVESITLQVTSPSTHSQSSSDAGHADSSTTPNSQYRYPAEISDEGSGHLPATAIYDPSVAGERSIPAAGDQPMAPQWAAIRSLREETAFHHERFRKLCRDLGDPVISKLLETYPDAQSIRNKGAQVVKDVLDGFRPRELSLIFAFTSFAYAISQLLYKDGRIEKCEILGDLRAWRSLITDPTEGRVFERIAQGLWPESKEHLHFIDIPVAAQRREMNPLFPGIPSSGASIGGSATPGFADMLPAHRQGVAEQNACLYPMDQFNLTNLDAAPYADTHRPLLSPDIGSYTGHLMNLSNEAFDYAALLATGPTGNLFPHSPPGSGSGLVGCLNSPVPPNGAAGASARRTDQPPSSEAGPKEMRLDETVMFLAVLVFLQDIAELVYTLSGRSLASRPQKLYKAEEKRQEALYRSVLEAFFMPRYARRDVTLPAFLALLSVAEKFIKSGLLRSVEDVKHYLVSVASAVFPPGELFERFVIFVLISASSSTTPTPHVHNRKRPRTKAVDDGYSSAEVPITAKRTRTCHTCNYEGCNASYSDRSALRKHQMQVHIQPPLIRCDEPLCGYGNVRRDRVREHFRRKHPGVPLPDRLRETRRGVHQAS